MPIRNIKNRQLGAWLFAAVTAPLAQFAGRMPWQTVAWMAGVCLVSCHFVGRIGVVGHKWLSVVQLCWLVWATSEMCRWISGSWFSGDVYPAIPLILLGVGVASARKGAEQAARTGSVVFWLLALIYGVVVVAGTGGVELRELSVIGPGVDMRLIVVLLVPALSVYLPGGEKKVPAGAMIGIYGFAVVISILITGTLSLEVATNGEAPLREWIEGVQIAGTLQRFEAIASVALTMGWFAMLSYLLCVAGQLAEQTREGNYVKAVFWAAAAAAGIMLLGVEAEASVLALGSVVLWVVAPVFEAIACGNKKTKKRKNNA